MHTISRGNNHNTSHGNWRWWILAALVLLAVVAGAARCVGGPASVAHEDREAITYQQIAAAYHDAPTAAVFDHYVQSVIGRQIAGVGTVTGVEQRGSWYEISVNANDAVAPDVWLRTRDADLALQLRHGQQLRFTGTVVTVDRTLGLLFVTANATTIEPVPNL